MSGAKYLLSHDLGTSGDKATLFSTDGTMVASVVASYDTHYFNDNWAEQNPMDWWNAFCDSTSALIAKTGVKSSDIVAVSFSGQMMACVCIDADGNPLRPAIIWADLRANEEAEEVLRHISMEDYYAIVGHRASAAYGLFKFMWVKKHEPEMYEATFKTVNAKDFIVYKLTGTVCTDYSDANSCGFFDLKNLSWSDRLLSYSGIDRDKLPEPKQSTFAPGCVTKGAAEATGLSTETVVVIGAGDGVASNVGAGSIAPGKTFCSLGTSAWIASTSEDPLIDESMRTVTWAHMVPGLYAPNGTMQYAGGSYSWLKNNLCGEEIRQASEENKSVYDLMNEEAARSVPGSNGVIFLPYLIGERAPRWNEKAKGCFIGIKAETGKPDIIRSVMEGVTYNLRIILEILESRLDIDEISVLGGGARGDLWCHIMADVFEKTIVVPGLLEEAASMGAAVCAGVGAGIYSDFSAIDRFIKTSKVIEPDKANAPAYKKAEEKFEAYYNALKDVF